MTLDYHFEPEVESVLIEEARLHPSVQFDKLIKTCQVCQFWNQTFDEDSWDFDVEEVRILLDE